MENHTGRLVRFKVQNQRSLDEYIQEQNQAVTHFGAGAGENCPGLRGQLNSTSCAKCKTLQTAAGCPSHTEFIKCIGTGLFFPGRKQGGSRQKLSTTENGAIGHNQK